MNYRWSPLLYAWQRKLFDLEYIDAHSSAVPTESLCYMHLVFERLQPKCRSNSKYQLKVQLIQSSTHNHQKIVQQIETQSLINGLVSKISMYQKEFSGLSKRSVYHIWCSFLYLLEEVIKGNANRSPKNSEGSGGVIRWT